MGVLEMAGLFRRAMDYLYSICVIIGCTALVLISAIIPWAVFTRYVLNSAASWPEPLAILLTIVLTFIGAAAAYRLNLHMNVSYFADQLPQPWRKLLDLVVQLLMALIAIFMVVWGERLVEVTWHNSIADFPFLSVGVTYLPIPVGGVFLLLFIVERIFLGQPPEPIAQHPEALPFE
jgi:TRAP-type C4-dicarboxylate transport system permease small subunit